MKTTKSKIRCGGMLAILALGIIAPTAKADFVFGEPTSLGPTVNSSAIDGHASISGDGLSLFFYSERSGGYGGRDIWVATRATIDEGWTSVENVGPPVNTPYRESAPSISADGLMLFFDSDRPGGSGGRDIWATTRETKDAPWTTPVNLGSTVNSSVHDYYSSVSADGLVLFFDVGLEDPSDNVWMTTRESRDGPWTPPVILGPLINSSWGDGEARISPDGLALVFASTRPGGYGSGWNLWVATRATADGDWGTPVNLGPTINDPSGAAGAIISADGSTLYFTSPRSGTIDLWQAPVIHIVDFNGDGGVDGADVRTMADRWGTDDPVCDIGPMPWGDGIVDVEDLKVLARYIPPGVNDPTLLAHWPLDETEGMIAFDSAGDHDGTVTGVPGWRPDDGQVNGTLELDGATFITVDTVLNPAEGPFSVLTWVRGGAPGQVIVSQEGGANWLMADPATGGLMTELKCGGRCAKLTKALGSDAIITDGAWHRIGVTWDGASRRLYADDVLVAEDTQDGLAVSSGGLILGSGKNMTPDTCWTGLIDDVRIYNRAVEP